MHLRPIIAHNSSACGKPEKTLPLCLVTWNRSIGEHDPIVIQESPTRVETMAMFRRIVLAASLVSAFIAATARPADRPAPAADVRKTLSRSLPFLEKHGIAWMQERGCLSCHNGAFYLWSHNEARRRGIAADSRPLKEWTDWALVATLSRGKEGGGLDTMTQLILGRDLDSPWRGKPERFARSQDPFEVIWESIIDRQKADGTWPVEGQLRSPPEITTMWTLLALASRDSTPVPDPARASALGLNPTLAKQMNRIDSELPKARDRALAWLKQAKLEDSTESLLLQVLVQRKFGDPAKADDLRRQLLARQHADGGWSYRNGDPESNAFATGQVLYALGIEEMGSDHVVVGNAWRYLVKSQRPDGSWRVTTSMVRPKESNPTKADFVYTYWGTAWATIGLSRTLPPAQ
jgi:squalene-hopene/tetraprenyl-beta-curcumene cyclase